MKWELNSRKVQVPTLNEYDQNKQDYENYKVAPQGTSIYETDKLYEKGMLDQLSKIVLENVLIQRAH